MPKRVLPFVSLIPVMSFGLVITWTPVKVWPASVRAMVALVVGKVMVVESVPARVRVLLTARVFPSVSVKVEPVAGVVRVILLMVVAEATPRVGVVRVGEVAKTARPEPVSSVIALARLALLGVARKVATPAPRPLTPVLIGRPVVLVRVPLVGVPKIGVVRVGEVAKTATPVPVSSVRTPASWAEVVAAN